MALEAEFCKKLDELMVEHNQVQALVARGLQELHARRRAAQDRGAMETHFDFGEFLDRFYLSRVGMRLLSGQHIMLHRPQARHSA
jgi:pyruvate dehydrogenase kinase 2/3/4